MSIVNQNNSNPYSNLYSDEFKAVNKALNKNDDNKDYIPRKQFNAAVINYIKSRSEADYDILHPLLTTMIELIMYKKTGKPNNGKLYVRKDYDSIKQDMYVRFFSNIHNYDESKGEPFSYFYCILLTCTISSSIEEDKIIKNNILLSEIAKNKTDEHSGDRGPITDNLDIFGHCEPTVYDEDFSTLFHSLFFDLKSYLHERIPSVVESKAKFMRFMIECIDRPDFEKLVYDNMYTVFQRMETRKAQKNVKVNSAKLTNNIFCRLYCMHHGKPQYHKYKARFNFIMNEYRQARGIDLKRKTYMKKNKSKNNKQKSVEVENLIKELT